MNKIRAIRIGLLTLLIFIVFGYGIGVGQYQWFPYHVVKNIKATVFALASDARQSNRSGEHRNETDVGIIYESLREDTEYYVILLAGQSNMVGFGDISDLKNNEQQLPAHIDYYNFGRESSLNYNLDGFGPEISLSGELRSFFPNENFVLIKFAVGGSSLFDWAPNWTYEQAAITGNPHFGPLYKKFLDKINHITSGKSVRFAALVWMQGERDARIPEAGKEYYDNFRKFVESIRSDLNEPNLPVLIGYVNPPQNRYPASEMVRDAQERAAKELKNVRLIGTDGIPKWNDDLHYSSEGQLELGKRFSRSLKNIIASQKGPARDGDSAALHPRR